jgi:hypothetical protein
MARWARSAAGTIAGKAERYAIRITVGGTLGVLMDKYVDAAVCSVA